MDLSRIFERQHAQLSPSISIDGPFRGGPEKFRITPTGMESNYPYTFFLPLLCQFEGIE